jgi:hypothetical protein
VVDHEQSADWDGGDEDVSLGDWAFRQDADVQWVSIAYDADLCGVFHAELADLFAAICLRDEAIERGTHRGEPLGAVDF